MAVTCETGEKEIFQKDNAWKNPNDSSDKGSEPSGPIERKDDCEDRRACVCAFGAQNNSCYRRNEHRESPAAAYFGTSSPSETADRGHWFRHGAATCFGRGRVKLHEGHRVVLAGSPATAKRARDLGASLTWPQPTHATSHGIRCDLPIAPANAF